MSDGKSQQIMLLTQMNYCQTHLVRLVGIVGVSAAVTPVVDKFNVVVVTYGVIYFPLHVDPVKVY